MTIIGPEGTAATALTIVQGTALETETPAGPLVIGAGVESGSGTAATVATTVRIDATETVLVADFMVTFRTSVSIKSTKALSVPFSIKRNSLLLALLSSCYAVLFRRFGLSCTT